MDSLVIYAITALAVILGLILVFGIPNFRPKKCLSNVCLVGKTALVTGGSMGLGYEIVLGLAQRGCRVIVADKVINNDIKNKIILETNNLEICMEFVDLGSFNSVRALAETLKISERKLDIVIHNAAIGECGGAMSEDGLNLTMQVNYYSPFLLTHLVIDLLKNSPSARLIFCSSNLASAFRNTEKYFKKIFGDYRFSKFCLLVIADIFAEKLKSYNITSNSFHPGIVKTQLHKQFFIKGKFKFISHISQFLFSWTYSEPVDAAQTPIYLACANEVQNITGTFFADMVPIRKPKDLQNKSFCENIWEASEKAAKLRKEELLL